MEDLERLQPDEWQDEVTKTIPEPKLAAEEDEQPVPIPEPDGAVIGSELIGESPVGLLPSSNVGSRMGTTFGKSDADRANVSAARALRSDPFSRSVLKGLRLRTTRDSIRIISGEYGLQDDPSRYQISVPIQQGNSGGPLLNMRGEVVGMITTMLGETHGTSGQPRPVPNISYAVKIDVIRQFLSQVPQSSPAGIGPRPISSDLESLAARVQDAVLIVMAE